MEYHSFFSHHFPKSVLWVLPYPPLIIILGSSHTSFISSPRFHLGAVEEFHFSSYWKVMYHLHQNSNLSSNLKKLFPSSNQAGNQTELGELSFPSLYSSTTFLSSAVPSQCCCWLSRKEGRAERKTARPHLNVVTVMWH